MNDWPFYCTVVFVMRSHARTVELRQTVLAGEAAREINDSLDVVVGSIGLLVTQLDPESDAHARAGRVLDEAKRIREMVNERTRVTRIPTWDRLRAIRSLLGGRSAACRRPPERLPSPNS